MGSLFFIFPSHTYIVIPLKKDPYPFFVDFLLYQYIYIHLLRSINLITFNNIKRNVKRLIK